VQQIIKHSRGLLVCPEIYRRINYMQFADLLDYAGLLKAQKRAAEVIKQPF